VRPFVTQLSMFAATVALILSPSGCSRRRSIDYRSADPVGDARRAFIDSGHFHTLAIKVRDSVISPVDATVLKDSNYNVEVGPEGPVVYLPIESAGDRPGWPSDDQLRYIKRYNTELYALLDTNFVEAGLPPNKRLKLPGAHK
jgi:hypothetical protein